MEVQKKVVIKIGSSSLTDTNGLLNIPKLKSLATAIATLFSQGWQPILVSSGAVATGLGQLNWDRASLTMPEKQAAAAVGQGLLMEEYNNIFATHQIQIAQILLTKWDLADRRRYINVRNTLNVLFEHNVLPVVNENDTVAYAEIRFGDNDTLSALIAGLVNANLLIILTDIDGLYSSDPRKDPNAKLIPVIKKVDEKIQQTAGDSGSLVGTGGMRTKLSAARIAASSGIGTIIASGKDPHILVDIASGKTLGTRIEPSSHSLPSRKQWIAFNSIPQGKLTIDTGATLAITQKKKSLLAVGVINVSGNFPTGSVVSVIDEKGVDLGKGIVNLSAEDLRILIHKPCYGLEVINRDWLCIKEEV